MSRRLTITDEYRTRMATDIKVSESTISLYLLTHSEKVAQYVADLGKLYRDYRDLEKEFNEKYTEKWSYYRFKYEYDTKGSDATQLTKGDAIISALERDMKMIEVDIKEIEGYLDALKQKYWAIKSFIDLRKFEAGE